MPDNEREDREERGDRGRDRGRDRADRERKPQEGRKSPLEMFLRPTDGRNRFMVRLKYFKGGKPGENAEFILWLGASKDDPYGEKIAADDTGTKAAKVKIDKDGLGSQGVRLLPPERFKDYTWITALGEGGISTGLPLPPLPVEESAELTPEPKPKAPADIECLNPPRDPDPTTRLFLLQVITRKEGVKADRTFTAMASPILAQFKQSTPTGFVDVTTFNPTATGSGTYQIFIGYTGRMTQIIFTLDDGQQASVWLRKRG